MANTIRIKRRPSSGSAGSPSAASLYNGELAFNENDNTLYYAYGSGVGGISTAVPAIAGSGAYSLRGGTNATGTWPISVDGNSASVSNGVYTTGAQTVGGQKTFSVSPVVSGNLAGQLVFKSANAVNGGNIIFDGVNLGSETSYIKSSTAGMDITHGAKIQLNSALEVLAANTSGNSVGYFAVFDSNPAGTLTQIKSVSKDQILDDIGAATSGLNITAGSGLVGGGTLSQNRQFDVGQGDGISVSADAIAVDSTVVRTTGTQTIDGVKTFKGDVYLDSWVQFKGTGLGGNHLYLDYDSGGSVGFRTEILGQSSLGAWKNKNLLIENGTVGNVSIESIFGKVVLLGASGVAISAGAASSGTHFAAFIDHSAGVYGYPGGIIKTRTAAQVKSDIGLGNVENLGLSGITFTAGSGLAGGGTLAANRTFDVGQGDGISVSADSIAVDSTVVRTTGNQTIAGVKTISDRPVLNSGLSVLMASTASSGLFFPVFTSDPSSAAQILASRTPSQVKGDIGLSNVTNDAQIKKLASTSGGFVPTWNGTTGDALNMGYSVETTLTGGAGALPRADAVKTYVDSAITSGIATNDAMIFKGALDCSANPNYPAGDRGWVYKISVAGKIGGASGPVVEVNDTIICGTDNTPSGTHAEVGSNWNILQTNIVDASILVTGPSSATSGNIPMFDGTTGKIIKDGGFLASDVARLSTTQTFTGVKSFGVINVGYQPISDPALTIYDDNNSITFRVTSGGSVTAGTWSATTIAADKGGTGQSSYAIGDLLYANTTTSLAKLANVSTGNVLLAGGVSTAPLWGKVGLTTHVSGTLPVANGGTNQTTYASGQLLIGNSSNTLTKATLTEGTGIDITNGNGSITITHEDTSSLSGAQGGNGIAAFTLDGMGHVTAFTPATYLTGETVCASIVDCPIDGGSF